jgi:hypothetical protein
MKMDTGSIIKEEGKTGIGMYNPQPLTHQCRTPKYVNYDQNRGQWPYCHTVICGLCRFLGTSAYSKCPWLDLLPRDPSSSPTLKPPCPINGHLHLFRQPFYRPKMFHCLWSYPGRRHAVHHHPQVRRRGRDLSRPKLAVQCPPPCCDAARLPFPGAEYLQVACF